MLKLFTMHQLYANLLKFLNNLICILGMVISCHENFPISRIPHTASLPQNDAKVEQRATNPEVTERPSGQNRVRCLASKHKSDNPF